MAASGTWCQKFLITDNSDVDNRLVKPRAKSKCNLIAEPMHTGAIVQRFLDWMIAMGFAGVWQWREIWDFYSIWYVHDVDVAPLPERLKDAFAFELAKHCQRGQVAVHEQGRRRRLTTYTVPDELPEEINLKQAA